MSGDQFAVTVRPVVAVVVDVFCLNISRYAILAATKTFRRNYGGGYLKPPTMNDMPVPKGDFNFLHAQRQAAYNTVLAIGAGSAGFGIFLVRMMNLIGTCSLAEVSFLSVQPNRHCQLPFLASKFL